MKNHVQALFKHKNFQKRVMAQHGKGMIECLNPVAWEFIQQEIRRASFHSFSYRLIYFSATVEIMLNLKFFFFCLISFQVIGSVNSLMYICVSLFVFFKLNHCAPLGFDSLFALQYFVQLCCVEKFWLVCISPNICNTNRILLGSVLTCVKTPALVDFHDAAS